VAEEVAVLKREGADYFGGGDRKINVFIIKEMRLR
jgi:hypothetical protein